MQDITPPNNRRSIRNISSSRSNGTEGSLESETENNNDSRKIFPEDNRFSGKSGNGKWVAMGALILIVVFVIGIGVISQFGKAEITIIPESIRGVISEEYTATRDGSEDLTFQSISLNDTKEAAIEATGYKFVEEKASGIITVFNNHSAESQILIENTRFESPNGLIFRIPDRIVVPGMEDGEAGSIDVRVYAYESGDNYNIGPTQFTIPGFEGTPQFESFYAVSNSSMRGGVSGEVPVVSDEDKESVLGNLEQEIREKLRDASLSEVPDNFILFPNASFIDLSHSIEEGEGDIAKLLVRGELFGILFNKKEFADKIAEDVFPEFGESAEIVNWDDLSFSLNESTKIYEGLEEFKFIIAGDIRIIKDIAKSDIINDLSGESRKATEDILIKHSGIREAEINISPFWLRSFPGNEDRIKINVIKNDSNSSDQSNL